MRQSVCLLLFAALAVPLHGEEVAAEKLRHTMDGYLGKPYVWGAAGLKAFDCSGFVWRVAAENGVFIKRTTARKLWFSTTPAKPEDRGAFGNLVFFNSLKHVGLVNDKSTFYHAQTSKGTNLSKLDAFWRPLVVGEHKFLEIAPAK